MPDPADPSTPTSDPAPSATPTVAPSGDAGPTPPSADPMDTDAGRRALAAERQRATDAERRANDLDVRLKAIEDKDKTDLERATALNVDLEARYATSEAQRLRLQVATSHSIGPDDLVLLTGTTESDLTAQAVRIAALAAASAAAKAPPAFAASTAQQAGNGTPVQPKASVAEGRSMFRSRHPVKTGT